MNDGKAFAPFKHVWIHSGVFTNSLHLKHVTVKAHARGHKGRFLLWSHNPRAQHCVHS